MKARTYLNGMDLALLRSAQGGHRYTVIDHEAEDGADLLWLDRTDKGTCPYFTKDGSDGAHGPNTCAFGCWEEPSCMTDVLDEDGWDVEGIVRVPTREAT